jgi:hypothetical protein
MQQQFTIDPTSPFPLELGGYSPQTVKNQSQRTGMARWGPNQECRHCHELLRVKHGLTPQGHSLGWLLRGFGPFCYGCNLSAWDAWKRGLFHGMTELSGY